MNRRPDADDWFAEEDFVEDTAPGAPAEEGMGAFADDWLSEENASPLRPSWAAGIDRRLLVGGAVLVVLLLIGLAAGGVFSGGGGTEESPSTAPATTSAAAPRTTTAATTTAAAPAKQLPPPATTLKPGDTGAEVATLQRALTSLGFSTGKVDSDYGPATTHAVAQFQSSAGLTADGILGPATLQALTTALHGP